MAADRRSIERLAENAGMRLVRDPGLKRWHLMRGQKLVRFEMSLDAMRDFLQSWARYVR